jgi:hypothetical protein
VVGGGAEVAGLTVQHDAGDGRGFVALLGGHGGYEPGASLVQAWCNERHFLEKALNS